jgi:transposase
MLGVVTTHDGDVPVGIQALDRNSSDRVSLPDLVAAVLTHLRTDAAAEPEEEAQTPLFAADSALYSTPTMQQFSTAHVRWASRVPETSTEAKAAMAEAATTTARWQTGADQAVSWQPRAVMLPQGTERWVVVRTQAGLERTQTTLARQVAQQREVWQRTLWRPGHQDFSCAPDAQAAPTHALKDLQAWLQVDAQVASLPRYACKGRLRTDASPDRLVWRVVQMQLTVNPQQVELEARRRACFLVATNVLDAEALPDRRSPPHATPLQRQW